MWADVVFSSSVLTNGGRAGDLPESGGEKKKHQKNIETQRETEPWRKSEREWWRLVKKTKAERQKERQVSIYRHNLQARNTKKQSERNRI